MGIKTGKQSDFDEYLALVKQFPLMSIRDDSHLAQAQEVIDRLLQDDLPDGAQDYLDALTDLVESYEESHIEIPDASEAEVLHELMRQHGLTQSNIGQSSRHFTVNDIVRLDWRQNAHARSYRIACGSLCRLAGRHYAAADDDMNPPCHIAPTSRNAAKATPPTIAATRFSWSPAPVVPQVGQ